MSFRNRVEYILKHNQWIMRCFVGIGSLIVRFVGLFVRVDNSLVLFCSYSGKFYNDSPRKIYEFMIKDEKCKDFQYVWALRKPGEVAIPGDCKRVKIDTWKYFITALKAGVWVTNVNIERGLRFKRKKQFLIHGTERQLTG